MRKKSPLIEKEIPIEQFEYSAKKGAKNLTSIEDADFDKTKTFSFESLVPMPTESIPYGIPLACSLYIKVGGRTLLFRRQGDRLSARRAHALLAKGAQHLYVHRSFWSLFMESLENLQLPPNSNDEEKAIHLRHLLVAYGQELEKRLKEPKKPYFDKLRQISEALAVILAAKPHMGTSLLRRDRDPYLYFVNHSVNVAIYSVLIGSKLKLPLEELKLVCYAALVANIGQLYIPKRIIYKSSALSEDEWELVRSHPRRGAELLESFSTPGPIVQAVLQHHEQWDGTGYPNGFKGEKIHPYARIIAIADSYDALTSNRPFEAAIGPLEALAEMARTNGRHDPNMIALVANKETMPPK